MVCVRVCVGACVRACVRVCVCVCEDFVVCMCVGVYMLCVICVIGMREYSFVFPKYNRTFLKRATRTRICTCKRLAYTHAHMYKHIYTYKRTHIRKSVLVTNILLC